MSYPVLLAEALKSPAPLQQPASALSTPMSTPIAPSTPFPPAPIIPPPVIPAPPNPSPVPISIAPLGQEGIVELKADQQTFDRNRQIFTAEGKVTMRFRDSLLQADRLQVNLLNRFAVAEGNVVLTKGTQVLRGDRFEYNFVQGQGRIQGARGEIATQSLQKDLSSAAPVLPSDVSAAAQTGRPVGQAVYNNQPSNQTKIQTPSGIDSRVGAEISIGNGFGQSTTQGLGYRRIRFEAAEADFFPDGWVAKDIRLTNDPFSPPELEIRARTATSRKISATEDEVLLDKPQIVFDQRFKLPIPRNRIVLGGKKDDPWLVNPGYDGGDRGGLYFERSFVLVATPSLYFSVTPEVYVQRAFSDSNIANWFGAKTTLSASLGRARLYGTTELTSLSLKDFEKRFRGSVQLAYPIGTHTLALQGAYRTRFFNGSLGFQDVQSIVGGIFYSPIIPLWDTGINLSYQVGSQYINADTDRVALLNPIRTNNRVSLQRYQASAALSRGFRVWQGQPLPSNQTEGLRYTPAPVVPYFDVVVGTTGTTTAYSNGDAQSNLILTTGFNAQFGHFSKPTFDYTALNITYSQALQGGSSPFLFDRAADTKTLAAGITQQIYGPWRAGFQTTWNVVDAKAISTDYYLEYSRRTYNFRVRYNPVLSLGSLNLTVSDFNWGGGSQPFDSTGITPVNNGVITP